METVDDIFAIWDSVADMARDLDMPYQTVSKWQQRARIPYESWEAVIKAAGVEGYELTFEQLAKINRPRLNASTT
jgi:hypothetical protein